MIIDLSFMSEIALRFRSLYLKKEGKVKQVGKTGRSVYYQLKQ